MADFALNDTRPDTQAAAKPDLHRKPHVSVVAVFLLFLISGIGYAGYGVFTDTHNVGEPLALSALALLGVALMIALGFEFVNGFHDTANAVATVIYTHSLPPLTAVIWSGVFNFLGVLVSTGAVAYSVITLLPVDLILQVGSTAGYAMIFALLIAAIVWNLATWSMGIPNSSSHCLIGSIMGVGLANELVAPAGQATSGVDWSQAISVGKALLFSPAVGFVLSAALLLVLKAVAPVRKLYEEPKGKTPWWIRGILILTCTGVSFAHGGNDGQKGMGLIMLILIGVAPTAYALNRTMPDSGTPAFVDITNKAKAVFAGHAQGAQQGNANDARSLLGQALKTRDLNRPDVYAALAALSDDVANGVRSYGSISRIPAAATPNMRNDMYLAADAIRLLPEAGAKLDPGDTAILKDYRTSLEAGTRFIPNWVKVSVAIALGLGTMVGWRRIVVTVGERIGKQHLTYAQGASAELVAAGTILGAEFYGMPVSTTHVLLSGVAGTMAANGSGLQTGTIRNIVLAWILTLPAAMLIAGCLYLIFRAIV